MAILDNKNELSEMMQVVDKVIDAMVPTFPKKGRTLGEYNQILETAKAIISLKALEPFGHGIVKPEKECSLVLHVEHRPSSDADKFVEGLRKVVASYDKTGRL